MTTAVCAFPCLVFSKSSRTCVVLRDSCITVWSNLQNDHEVMCLTLSQHNFYVVAHLEHSLYPTFLEMPRCREREIRDTIYGDLWL